MKVLNEPNPPQQKVSWIATSGGQFRLAAIAEACSWAGLLGGMLLKYGVILNPIGVQVMGPIHGLLFVIYIVASLRVAYKQEWSGFVTLVALAVAVPPFATWLFERWALKRGMLGGGTIS